MSNQLTRRDFAIRSAGFGLALGLAPAATLAEAEQASRSETSPAVAHPYSLVDPEFLPALKQFPAVDLSAEIVRKFRQSPSMPPLPGPAPQPARSVSWKDEALRKGSDDRHAELRRLASGARLAIARKDKTWRLALDDQTMAILHHRFPFSLFWPRRCPPAPAD